MAIGGCCDRPQSFTIRIFGRGEDRALLYLLRGLDGIAIEPVCGCFDPKIAVDDCGLSPFRRRLVDHPEIAGNALHAREVIAHVLFLNKTDPATFGERGMLTALRAAGATARGLL